MLSSLYLNLSDLHLKKKLALRMESAVRASIGKEWGIYEHQSGNTVIVHASDVGKSS